MALHLSENGYGIKINHRITGQEIDEAVLRRLLSKFGEVKELQIPNQHLAFAFFEQYEEARACLDKLKTKSDFIAYPGWPKQTTADEKSKNNKKTNNKNKEVEDETTDQETTEQKNDSPPDRIRTENYGRKYNEKIPFHQRNTQNFERNNKQRYYNKYQPNGQKYDGYVKKEKFEKKDKDDNGNSKLEQNSNRKKSGDYHADERNHESRTHNRFQHQNKNENRKYYNQEERKPFNFHSKKEDEKKNGVKKENKNNYNSKDDNSNECNMQSDENRKFYNARNPRNKERHNFRERNVEATDEGTKYNKVQMPKTTAARQPNNRNQHLTNGKYEHNNVDKVKRNNGNVETNDDNEEEKKSANLKHNAGRKFTADEEKVIKKQEDRKMNRYEKPYRRETNRHVNQVVEEEKPANLKENNKGERKNSEKPNREEKKKFVEHKQVDASTKQNDKIKGSNPHAPRQRMMQREPYEFRNLYILNLPKYITQGTLFSLCKSFVEVDQIIVYSNRNNIYSSPYAKVTTATKADCAKLIKAIHGNPFQGKIIYAMTKDEWEKDSHFFNDDHQ